MSQTPLHTVDIIIPTLNEEQYLGACLEALAKQDYPKELVTVYVIDNASTDRTVAIADQFNTVVLTQDKRNASAARNKGILQGKGDLLGFLDAHCIPNESWIRSMAKPFQDYTVGAAIGNFENISVNARIEAFMQRTGMLKNEKVLENTLSGKRNPFPWVLGGNSMYRRQAVETAGLFDERLCPSEDVDLPWKVSLLGYQLVYAPGANVIHYDCNRWLNYLKKHYYYGRGISQIAYIYGVNVPLGSILPFAFGDWSLEWFLMCYYYGSGFLYRHAQLQLGLGPKLQRHTYRPVLETLRPCFEWIEQTQLSISRHVIYWTNPEQRFILSYVPTKSRFELDLSGSFFWRGLSQGKCRAQIIEEAVAYFEAQGELIGEGLDQFVETFLQEDILELHLPNQYQQPACTEDAAFALG